MEKVKHPCKELSIGLVPGLQNTSVWRGCPLVDAQLNLAAAPRRKVTTVRGAVRRPLSATFLAREPNKHGGILFVYKSVFLLGTCSWWGLVEATAKVCLQG